MILVKRQAIRNNFEEYEKWKSEGLQRKGNESTGVQEYAKSGRTWKDLEGLNVKQQKGAKIYVNYHGNALLIDIDKEGKFRAEKWNRDEGPQLQRKGRDVTPVNEEKRFIMNNYWIKNPQGEIVRILTS